MRTISVFTSCSCVHLMTSAGCRDYRLSNEDNGVPRNFFRGRGVQQIQLRTEDRQNGDLGTVAP